MASCHEFELTFEVRYLASFQELLIVFSISIFAFVLFLILISKKNFGNSIIQKLSSLRSPLFLKILYRVHFSLIVLFLVIAVYSYLFGLRPSLYYAVFVSLFLTSVLLVLTSGLGKKRLITRTLLATVVVISLVQCLLPIAENRFIIYGSDQWRDIFATKLITEQGNFATAGEFSSGYYSIPLFSVFNAVITLFTGNVQVSFAVFLGALSIIMALMIYYILLKLSGSQLASVLGIFIFLSTPRTALLQAVPSLVSLVLGAVLISLFIEYARKPRRSIFLPMVLVASSALIFHPIGIIAVILICVGFILFHFVGVAKQSYPQSNIILGLFVLLCLLSIAYWSLNNPIFISILNPLERLLRSIPSSIGGSVYTPRYFVSASVIFSFVWALPVGISAAYTMTSLYDLIRGRKTGNASGKNVLNLFPVIIGVIGLPLIIVAFVSVINAPEASVERYINEIAYLFLVFASAIICSKLINSKLKLAAVGIICLLSVSIYIGAGSPDWAPIENPSFGAIFTTYTGYVEANTITRYLPDNIGIYTDYDIPLDGVARMANVSFSVPVSFQTVRNVLDSIKAGTFDPYAPIYPDSSVTLASLNTTYTVKVDQIQNTTAIDNHMNILYSSGFHVFLRTP